MRLHDAAVRRYNSWREIPLTPDWADARAYRRKRYLTTRRRLRALLREKEEDRG